MNNTKIRILAALLAVMMILVFVACNGSGTGEGSTSETVTDKEGTQKETDKESSSNSESKTESNTESEKVTEEETEAPDVEITENGESADVVSSIGLKYKAEGFDSVSGDSFVYKKGLTITFEEGAFSEEYNRMSLTYKSSAPVHIYVTYYDKGGNEISADYYLEEGEGVFSAVVNDYINKKRGVNLSKIVVDTCENETAEFALYHAKTERIDVYTGLYGSKTYYIENERFKLGIDMGWGGTINYIADLTQSIDGLDNLINKHDTGRLVQQSYYGIGAIDGIFEWGSFNESNQWPYNPVQGGDKGNVSSKLIDVQVGDNYVYIKSQPMDWGKVNYITPSYMENKYILEDDFIRIDNRFVDFSGWEHPYRGQELPAFYTVSYLDTFIWYDGTQPWTGDEISSRDNLQFWGDSKYVGDCMFYIRDSNTETWCAWVNTDDDFGVGLYVPNVDRLKAGRYQYNGSKDGSDNATNYVAPYNTMKLVSYEALEYSYLIATGTAAEIRETFTENKDFATNESLHKNYVNSRLPDTNVDMSNIDFTVKGNEKVFTNPNCATIEYDEKEKAAKLTSVGDDPYTYLNFVMSNKECVAEDYAKIEIVYMVPTSNANASYSCQLFTCTGEQTSATGSMVINARLINDGKYNTLTIDVGSYTFWKGKINQLRLDFFNSSENGDVIYIKSVKLVEGSGSNSGSSIVLDGTRIDLSKQDNLGIFSNPRNTEISYDSDIKAAKLFVYDANDVSVTIPFGIFPDKLAAEDYSTLKIEYMIPTSNTNPSYVCDLFLCAGEIVSPNGDARIRVDLIADGEFHVLEVDLSQNSYWKGDINMIRFDYFDKCVVNDVIFVKSMELAE